MRARAALCAATLLACAADPAAPVDAGPAVRVELLAAPSLADALTAYAEDTPSLTMAVTSRADPRAALAQASRAELRVAVLRDLAPCECFRLERDARGLVVHAGDVLGAQYGVTELLEGMGAWALHPTRARVPAGLDPAAIEPARFGPTFTPEQRVRGIQLHTLHPIEGLDAWWPSEGAAGRARAVFDWVIKNRGNFVNVVALDDIQRGADAEAAWRPHVQALIARAHRRGLRVGVGIQLFGRSNLQRAFDLVEQPDAADARDVLRARLDLLLRDVPWDHLNLNFGEFFGADPAAFIAWVNEVRSALDARANAPEMSATVHVGNSPDLRVTWMGREQLYYFLVRYADPRIIPWVHTVMYYPLSGSAGGAYRHEDFFEHRDYLLERMQTDQRAAYFPESAYWVAFDNSVPTYLPVYLRARHEDLADLRARGRRAGAAPLRDHVLFSSGWEWAYWQTDAAVLRAGFTLPDRWIDPIARFYAYAGEAGARAARAVERLGDAQYDALIVRRAAAYYAGREAILDAGEATMGIIAQPTRPTFAAVARNDSEWRLRFRREVIEPLSDLVTETEGAQNTLRGSGIDRTDPFLAELDDAVAVDLARARFALAVWSAAVGFGDGGRTPAVDALLAQADTALAEGRAVVARRHGALHWPDAPAMLTRRRNPTLYQHGYLHYANSLCFWERERVQLRALVLGDTAPVPGCVL